MTLRQLTLAVIVGLVLATCGDRRKGQKL